MNRVLVFATYPESDASFRYRIRPYVEYLENENFTVKVFTIFSETMYRNRNKNLLRRFIVSLQLSYKLLFRIFQLLLIRNSDQIIFHREFFPFFLPFFEKLAIKRSKYSILDFDDALYVFPSAGRDWRAKLRNPDNFHLFARSVNRIIVSSPILFEWASKFNQDVALHLTLPQKRHLVEINSAVSRIVWIGSDSSFVHLLSIMPVLKRIALEENVELHILGGDMMNSYIWPPKFNFELWSIDRESEVLNSPFIGIMPLVTDEWSVGKGGFKALQYMSVGMPVVASPVGINTEIVSESNCGLLANSDDEWEMLIRTLLQNSKLCSTYGKNGHDWISKKIAQVDYSSLIVI